MMMGRPRLHRGRLRPGRHADQHLHPGAARLLGGGGAGDHPRRARAGGAPRRGAQPGQRAAGPRGHRRRGRRLPRRTGRGGRPDRALPGHRRTARAAARRRGGHRGGHELRRPVGGGRPRRARTRRPVRHGGHRRPRQRAQAQPRDDPPDPRAARPPGRPGGVRRRQPRRHDRRSRRRVARRRRGMGTPDHRHPRGRLDLLAAHPRRRRAPGAGRS